MRRLLALIPLAVAVGCAPSGEISEADAAKNKADFSQESYEAAMKKAGKGDELAAEKERNAAYSSGTPQEAGQR